MNDRIPQITLIYSQQLDEYVVRDQNGNVMSSFRWYSDAEEYARKHGWRKNADGSIG